MQTDGTSTALGAAGGTRRDAASAKRGRIDAFVSAIVAARVDIAIVCAITVLAAVLRLWDIGSTPPGIHGDEAWTGIDARRILKEGWIGVYVGSALGQPTGPLYWTAFLFTFLPETTTTVRSSMAVFGIATIPLAYLAFATMFNRTVAAFAALLLTVMMWHLHLSRLGFMVITWPFIEMAILFALFQGYRRQQGWIFVVAGALAGLGVYTYNSYLLFLPVLGATTLWIAARAVAAPPWRWRPITVVAAAVVVAAMVALASPVRHALTPLLLSLPVVILLAIIAIAAAAIIWLRPRPWSSWTMLGALAAFWIMAFVVAAPMLRFIDNNTPFYRQHQRSVGVVYKDPWKQADGWTAKADILWERAKEWERAGVNAGRPDLGDGLATSRADDKGKHPVVDPITFVLAVVGIGVAIWNWKKAEYVLLLFALLILPWATLLTVADGLFRRTLGLAPIVAVLAAFPLAWLWERIWRKRSDSAVYAYACLVLLVPGYVGARTVQQFFGPVQDTPEIAYVFPYQLDAASRYMADLPEGTYIYFWSNRWSFNYETRRFQAPDAMGEDRSVEFRRPPQGVDPADFKLEPIDYTADTSKNVAFVFLGPYIKDAVRAEEQYPGGQGTDVKRGDEVLFHAYYLPAD